ncbi:MAG TPA: efflux RND transporter permease subunit [Gemmataceae bacterium]
MNRPVLGLVLAVCAVLPAGGVRAEGEPVLVRVGVSFPGASPEEVEVALTVPVEQALQGTEGLRRLRSVSGDGAATVWAEFAPGTDPSRARRSVAQRLATVREFPEGSDPPVIRTASVRRPVLLLAVHSDAEAGGQAVRLQALAEQELRPRLQRVPRFEDVRVLGGARRRVEVIASPEKLAVFRIAPSELAAKLGEALAKRLGREDLSDVILAVRDGTPVRLQDVAAVREGVVALPPAKMPGVLVAVWPNPDADEREMSRAIAAVVAEAAARLPAGVRVGREVPVAMRPFLAGAAELLSADLPPDFTLRPGAGKPAGTVLVPRPRGAVAVRICGDGLDALHRAADTVRADLRAVEGVSGVEGEPGVAAGPKLDVRIDREKAARLGVTVPEISLAIDLASRGRGVGRVGEEAHPAEVIVRLGGRSPGKPEELGGVALATPGGKLVPLREVAAFAVTQAPGVIRREEGRRCVTLHVRFEEGGDPTRLLPRLRKVLPAAGGAHTRLEVLEPSGP